MNNEEHFTKVMPCDRINNVSSFAFQLLLYNWYTDVHEQTILGALKKLL